MKANLPRSVTGKGPFHGHDIRLTIGLIVKNEEKTLGKCLDSVRPLLDAVPSELIITDTGSTDRTVEIARRYTDHIIHFEWCDDFAAARNTGLQEARGEWFMFLDGDEWFEDTTEIIDFFNSGECDGFWGASYNQRNYHDFEGKVYSDFRTHRIYRMYAGIQFHNLVHESIPRVDPVKILSAYVHHYGYVYKSVKDQQQKHERNMQLLQKELAIHPDNLKMYLQMATEYKTVNDFTKSVECCETGLQMEKKHPNGTWRLGILHNLFNTLFIQKNYQILLDKMKEYLQENDQEELQYLDFYRWGQTAAGILEKYEVSIQYGDLFLSLYKKYENHKLDETMRFYSQISNDNNSSRNHVIIDNVKGSVMLNQLKSAIDYLELIHEPTIGEEVNAIGICFLIVQKYSQCSLLGEFYQKVLKENEKIRKENFINMTEDFLSENLQCLWAVVDVFANLDIPDSYVYLNRLRLAEHNNDTKETACLLDYFANSEIDWTERFSDVLYYAMKDEVNIMPYLMRLDTDELPYFSAKLFKQHPDFVQLVPEYFRSYSFENPKGLFWSNCLKERAVLAQKEPEDEEAYLTLFEDYARQTAAYVRKLYRPEMFSSANLAALPRAHRFGYYMGEAFTAQKRGNDADYLENLRLALKSYPIMEKPIGMLLERFENEQKRELEKAEEFQKLAQKVKAQIESLIADDHLEEAGKITAQLAELLPNDEDVIRYRVLTHTEPSMREIAAKLPQ